MDIVEILSPGMDPQVAQAVGDLPMHIFLVGEGGDQIRFHGFGQPHAGGGCHGKDQGDGHAWRGLGRSWEKAGKAAIHN